MTEMTLSFPGVPDSVDSAMYEIWVVVFESNKSYADWYTSPLDLR